MTTIKIVTLLTYILQSKKITNSVSNFQGYRHRFLFFRIVKTQKIYADINGNIVYGIKIFKIFRKIFSKETENIDKKKVLSSIISLNILKII